MAFQTTSASGVTETFDPSHLLYHLNGSYHCGDGGKTFAGAADASYIDAGGGLHVNPAMVATLEHVGANPAGGNTVVFVGGAYLSLTQAQYDAIKGAL